MIGGNPISIGVGKCLSSILSRSHSQSPSTLSLSSKLCLQWRRTGVDRQMDKVTALGAFAAWRLRIKWLSFPCVYVCTPSNVHLASHAFLFARTTASSMVPTLSRGLVWTPVSFNVYLDSPSFKLRILHSAG